MTKFHRSKGTDDKFEAKTRSPRRMERQDTRRRGFDRPRHDGADRSDRTDRQGWWIGGKGGEDEIARDKRPRVHLSGVGSRLASPDINIFQPIRGKHRRGGATRSPLTSGTFVFCFQRTHSRERPSPFSPTVGRVSREKRVGEGCLAGIGG